MNQQDEINALQAQVNRLRHCLQQARNDEDREAFERCLGRTLASTKEQCLAEVKANAIEEFVKANNHYDRDIDGDSYSCISPRGVKEYVNKLRKQAK